ncbi:Nucleotidyltransferase [Candidatus Sulfopaludibacter sp. SbA4]|nr:Nucleotidyltransferase [Candidatus Sulfopaludibacter sp. SbA4]
MRDDRERLLDILEAIERIERHTAQGLSAFSDELVQTWVVHHLMIIGEACRALSASFRSTHHSEEWALAAGLRNVIVHEYFGVDIDVVWGVVERDLPSLKGRIQEILGEAQEETPGEALP